MLGLSALPDMFGMPSIEDVDGRLASPEQIALWEMLKQRPEIQDIFSRDWSGEVMSSGGADELMGGAYSDVIDRFATLESGGGELRSNPMSSARGLLHFLPSTWAGVLRNYPDLGFAPADIDDDAKQRRAAEVLMEREIVPSLRRTLGREPTGAEIYTAWGLGAPDAGKLFQADPNAPAASLFRPKVASSNPSIFYRDKEGTIPRTAAEVAAEYARRFNGAKPTKEAPPMQPEYDVDQGIANMNDMAQRVGQMRPGLSALGPQQQPQGLSALSPYLQLARQLSPSRESNWGDALINAGAAMMQSTRPDFLGGLGAGLQAGNNTLSQGREQMRGDGLKQFSLAMDLAKFDQKDGGEYAMSDGVLYNKRTGATQQVGAGKAPQTRVVERGDKKITQEWNGAMWKDVGEAPAYRPDKPGEVETLIRLAGIEPNSPEGRAMAARILEKKAKGEDGGPFPGSSIDASSYNNMIAYNEKVRTGQPTTPQEDMAYSIAYQHASKPTRWQTPDGAMYEAPGIDVSGMVPPKIGAPAPPPGPSSARQTAPPTTAAGQPESRPSGAGVGAQPGTRQIVPPDEKPVAGDSAGRFALVPEARQALDQAQKGYFPDGKSFDRTMAGVAWANVPGTKGAEIYNAVSRAIANRLRIESGAAAPPAEVEAMVKRYLPAPWDSDDMARQKLDGLKQYFDAFAVSATKGAGPAIRGEGGSPASQPRATNDLPPPEAFATMDRAAIDQMTPRVRDMTDDQLRALQARRRQLLGITSGSGMTGSGGAP
jgi:hypothetical protein